MAHVCPWWFGYTFDNPLRRLFHDPAAMFGPYAPAGAHAVDVGCGLGYFTIGLARLVGPSGRVTAIDVQQKMLDITLKRSRRAGVDGAVDPLLARGEALHLDRSADFVLAFWMLHEATDERALVRAVRRALSPGGVFFVAEPKIHVSRRHFERQLAIASEEGLVIAARPHVALSHAAVLRAA